MGLPTPLHLPTGPPHPPQDPLIKGSPSGSLLPPLSRLDVLDEAFAAVLGEFEGDEEAFDLEILFTMKKELRDFYHESLLECTDLIRALDKSGQLQEAEALRQKKRTSAVLFRITMERIDAKLSKLNDEAPSDPTHPPGLPKSTFPPPTSSLMKSNPSGSDAGQPSRELLPTEQPIDDPQGCRPTPSQGHLYPYQKRGNNDVTNDDLRRIQHCDSAEEIIPRDAFCRIHTCDSAEGFTPDGNLCRIQPRDSAEEIVPRDAFCVTSC